MFKLNRAAAIETVKVISFSIVVAVATALIVNFVNFELIMIGFLVTGLMCLIKLIYDHHSNKSQHD